MSEITLEEARKHLRAWLDAELAVTTGQSYSIGSKSMTRANIAEIRKQIDYWESKVMRLKAKKRRVRYVVPRG